MRTSVLLSVLGLLAASGLGYGQPPGKPRDQVEETPAPTKLDEAPTVSAPAEDGNGWPAPSASTPPWRLSFESQYLLWQFRREPVRPELASFANSLFELPMGLTVP